MPYISLVQELEQIAEWFVVHTKTNAEKRVQERLQAVGFEVYLPLLESLRQWSDRKKKVKLPLIRSVVFVRCTRTALNGVYAVSGVQAVLKHLGKPAVVRPAEIQNLQLLLQESSAVSIVSERIAPGSPVVVTAGPFKGMHATALEELNAYRLQISLEALGVAYAVSVPKQFVQLI